MQCIVTVQIIKNFVFCSCKSPSSGVLITHCTRCWDSRKQWAPERPRRKRRTKKEKAKVTTLVVPEGMDDTDGGSTVEGEIDRPRSDTMSSQDSGIGSQEFEMLELTETEVVAPPSASLDLTKLGRSISLDTTSMSSSSSTSGSMTMDTSELSELGSMSDMKAMSRGAEMCMFCEMRPRNAIFIHGKLGHQVWQFCTIIALKDYVFQNLNESKHRYVVIRVPKRIGRLPQTARYANDELKKS